MTRLGIRRWWQGSRREGAVSSSRPLRLRGAAALALLIGIAALAAQAGRIPREPLSWDALLAPYSTGTPLPDGFRLDAIQRGAGNDVVISIRRPGDGATVEVHVLPRGRWSSIRETASFGIGYETPHSSADEREAITELLAATVRAHDRGLPAPDAIPLRAAFDPTVLPWWLDMLRGGRGLLLGSSLALLAVIALVPSPRLAHAGVALGIADLGALSLALPALTADLGGQWMVPVAAALLLAALHDRPLGSRADHCLALAVVAAALLLRGGLGPWGPLHVNGYAPLFIEAAARDPAAIAAYGPGYLELFGPIAHLAPANPDWAVFAANALLSALVAALAFALGRLAGLPRPAAAAAALLLAIDPIAIRSGATESYFPALIVLCSVAAAALLAAAREPEVGSGWRVAACGAAAGLLLAQATRIHPSGWGLAATVPFIVLAGAARTASHRLRLLLVSGGLAAGVLCITSAGVLLDVLGNIRSGTLMQLTPPLSLWPLTWIAAAAIVYAIVAPQRGLAVPAGLCAAALIMTRHGYAQSWVWQQSYDRLYLTLPLIAAVAAIPAAAWRRTWIVVPAALLLALAWIRLGLPVVAARTTDHLEYRWLRHQLAALPPQCRVIYLASADKRGIALPTYVGTPPRSAVAMLPREPHTIEAALAPAACRYYVRTSLCASEQGRPACAAIEQRLSLEPLAQASFPALPSSPFFAYDRDPVETVIARAEVIASDASRSPDDPSPR